MFKRWSRLEWFITGAMLTILVVIAYSFWMAAAQ
jgi:hypothetical protein